MRSRFFNVSEKFVILCLVLFLFLLFFYPAIETEDIWWHLSAGQWIIGHMQLPHFDPFPFAYEKIPWMQNNEWLGSVIIYSLYKLGGLLGLKIFRSLIFLSVISVFFFYARKRIPMTFLIVLVLLIAYGLLYRYRLKPEIFNLFFIQVFLINLFAYENGASRKRLFILPVIGVLWFNIHMGAVVYGIPLILIFLLAACIRYFDYRLKGNGLNKDLAAAQAKNIALVLFTYLIGFFINPYGVQGFLYPFKTIFDHSLIDFKAIPEMQPPAGIFLSLHYSYFFILSALGFLAVFLNKNRFTLIVLFSFSFFAFLYASRNSYFFVLVSAFVIIEGAQYFFQKDIWRKAHWRALIDVVIKVGVAFFLVIQASKLLSESVFVNGKRSKALLLEANPYVTSSLNVLKNNGIIGPVFCDTALGDSILWFGYPRLRPFDDGRHADKVRFNNAMSILSKPESVWLQAEKDYSFKIVIGFQGGPAYDLIKYINTQPDWQLISIRGNVVVYVKKGAFHLPEELDGFEQRLRSDVLTDTDIKQLKILSQKRQGTFLDNIFDPSPVDVDMFDVGETLMYLGYDGAAAKSFINAFKVSDQLYMKEEVNYFLKHLSKE